MYYYKHIYMIARVHLFCIRSWTAWTILIWIRLPTATIWTRGSGRINLLRGWGVTWSHAMLMIRVNINSHWCVFCSRYIYCITLSRVLFTLSPSEEESVRTVLILKRPCRKSGTCQVNIIQEGCEAHALYMIPVP